METHRFDDLVMTMRTRRSAIGLVAGIAALLGMGHEQAAARNLCRKNGTSCKQESRRCKSKFCLKTPFTIEARWPSGSQDHDAILFVPQAPGNSVPFPYIDYACLASDTNDGTLYPFAFSSGDAQGPGDEVITVRRLLAGKYEFWGRIHGPAAFGDLTVTLRNANGKVVRAWSSPPNPSGSTLLDWHVFDIKGGAHSVTVSNKTITGLFSTVRADSTYVCPA
jgi:hypothetical protein